MGKLEEELLALVRRYTQAERWEVSSHGVVRMRERGASFADIEHGLLAATRCRRQPGDRWRLESEDLDGDDLTLVVFVDDGVLVITLF